MNSPNFSVKQRLQLAACTNCRACAEACPAFSASNDGQLSALFRMQGLKELLQRRSGLLGRLFARKPSATGDRGAFADTVFRCTLCGNCQEVCPVGIHLKDLWLDLRREMVEGGRYPKKINMIRDNLAESHNVFDEDNEERAEWVEDMREPPDDLFVREKADVVYFTGCTAAYFPVAQKIPIAFAEILRQGGVDFSLLGEDEWCCGFPLLGAGSQDMLQEFIDHNIEAVRARGARHVIFACPSCFETWKTRYPYRENGLEIFHSTQYLLRMVQERQLPLQELSLKVTYHDPCDLGRGARIFDAPRELIRSIPGVTLVEMAHNREQCTCCGGGGNLEMIDAVLSTTIARAKIDEALATGAQAIVTSCQQCVRTMLTFAKRNKIAIEVMDITQLLRKALP